MSTPWGIERGTVRAIVGTILNEGAQHMTLTPWEVSFPAILPTLLVLSFTFIGDGLRDAIDPRD
jgi:oligopeptide transport system permease protein